MKRIYSSTKFIAICKVLRVFSLILMSLFFVFIAYLLTVDQQWRFLRAKEVISGGAAFVFALVIGTIGGILQLRYLAKRDLDNDQPALAFGHSLVLLMSLSLFVAIVASLYPTARAMMAGENAVHRLSLAQVGFMSNTDGLGVTSFMFWAEAQMLYTHLWLSTCLYGGMCYLAATGFECFRMFAIITQGRHTASSPQQHIPLN